MASADGACDPPALTPALCLLGELPGMNRPPTNRPPAPQEITFHTAPESHFCDPPEPAPHSIRFLNPELRGRIEPCQEPSGVGKSGAVPVNRTAADLNGPENP